MFPLSIAYKKGAESIIAIISILFSVTLNFVNFSIRKAMIIIAIKMQSKYDIIAPWNNLIFFVQIADGTNQLKQ